MKEFEDHWRKNINQSDEAAGFLSMERKEKMWQKINAPKYGFEQKWEHKFDDVGGNTSELAQQQKVRMWNRIAQPLSYFEKDWQSRFNDPTSLKGFLSSATKLTLGHSVLPEVRGFEAAWHDKMSFPNSEEGQFLEYSKNAIWNNISKKLISSEPHIARKSKTFAFHWTHAAALLIGIIAAGIFWNSADRNSTIEVKPIVTLGVTENEPDIGSKAKFDDSSKESVTKVDLVHPVANFEEITSSAKMSKEESSNKIVKIVANVSQMDNEPNANVIASISEKKQTNTQKVDSKERAIVTLEEENKEVELAKEKVETGASEIEIVSSIAKGKTSNKKVLHISDIRPSEGQSRGGTIYSRAFGKNEKSNDGNNMTVNTLIKNYK